MFQKEDAYTVWYPYDKGEEKERITSFLLTLKRQASTQRRLVKYGQRRNDKSNMVVGTKMVNNQMILIVR